MSYDPTLFLKEVETKYPVASIKVGGEQVWPIIRISFATANQLDGFTNRGERRNYDLDFSKYPANMAYHWPQWFGRHKYIALGMGHNRKLINGKRYDRFLDPIIEELGDTLYLEQPAPRHEGNEYTQHVVSQSLPIGLRTALAKRTKKLEIDGEWMLLNMGRKVPYEFRIRNFMILRGIYRRLFQWKKPKLLLLTNYYGFAQPAIKAAHDLGITVIEAQHGVIGKAHYAYHAYAELDKSYFPDWFLSFGRNDIKDCTILPKGRIVPVGSYYIEHVKRNFVPDPVLENQILPQLFADKVVGVALQLGFEKTMAEFCNEAARLDRNICYLLIPRFPDAYLDNMALEPNVLLYKTRSFLEIIPQCDFHATVSSTTAVEAPSLGVRNILVDLEGDSSVVYGWPESEINRYVKTPQEIVNAVNTYPPIPRDRVIALNRDNIEPNYQENIRRFVHATATQNPPRLY